MKSKWIGSAATGTGAVLIVAAILLLISALSGCATTASRAPAIEPEEAIDHLGQPLEADPAILYRLRVASSSNLRLALLTSGEAGRITVSEPFGSAVSLTSWSGVNPPMFFDLREGCQIEISGLAQVLGVAAMPLPQAARLLAGKLPAAEEDHIVPLDDGRILIEGQGWKARVTVEPDPWRVVSVEEAGNAGKGWRIRLGDHSLSVPGKVRVKREDGRWAELDLIRLEWNTGKELPTLPTLPRCVVETDR